MDDRELTVLAAHAAGVKFEQGSHEPHPKSGAWFGLWLTFDGEPPEHARRYWNPLTDDGDALRLAARLRIDLEWQVDGHFNPADGVEAYRRGADNEPIFCAFELVDYRRAIVRAAAEIGRSHHGD